MLALSQIHDDSLGRAAEASAHHGHVGIGGLHLFLRPAHHAAHCAIRGAGVEETKGGCARKWLVYG